MNADIKNAFPFLQIVVNEKHRNFIRFSWYNDVGNIHCNNILTLWCLISTKGLTANVFTAFYLESDRHHLF